MAQRRHQPPSGPAGTRGATMVEVSVVVGIVVLLAVVVLTSVSGIQDRQRRSACKAELAKIQTAVEAYRALPGHLNPTASPPASITALQAAGLLDGKVGTYVAYSRVRSGGHWVARYANGPQGNCAPG